MKKDFCGYTWNENNDNDGWYTIINEKIIADVWPFGSIYQCKIFINNFDINNVGISLEPKQSVQDAMQHCIDYAKIFLVAGPPSMQSVFEKLYRYRSNLWNTRIKVIAQVLICGGGGYDWVNGCIMDTSPEDKMPSYPDPRILDDKAIALFQRMIDQGEEKYGKEIIDGFKEIVDKDKLARKERDEVYPLEDTRTEIDFGFVSKENSNITNVPDNARADWLALVYEAAILLRDRSGGQYKDQNIALAKDVIKDLEKRFPQLVGQ